MKFCVTLILPFFLSAINTASSQFNTRCKTISGPVPKDTPCVFPFIYRGVTYLGCAGDPAEDKMADRWCSTKVDAEGNHMEGTNHYGYCPSSCPSHYEIQSPQVTVTPHGVTAVPAITRKPKVTTPSLPPKMKEEMNDAKDATGISKESPPEIQPSPVDPGVAHPHGYHPVGYNSHHADDYHHKNHYHDPCYGKGVCVSSVQCPSRFRENATQCYLGHYTVGLCCNAILENPEGAKFLEKAPFPPSNGYNDFSRIPNAVINYAAEMGARFADNVTTTLGNGARLRLEASGKSAAFRHFRFQRQAPGVGRLTRLAIIGGSAGKMLRSQLLGPYASTIRFNFVGADIRGTRLERDCPALPDCPVDDKYRTFDGSCNNLQNTEWGKANTDVQRVLDNAYDDGVFIPRLSSSSRTSLPSARAVSNAIVSTDEKPSNTFTALIMTFGQFIDHDLTHIPNARVGEDEAVDCCGAFNQELPQPGDLTPEEEIVCFPIRIPKNDQFYAGKQKCINFVRSTTSPPTSCQPGPFEQVNQITHWLDNSNVYGSGGNDSIEVRRFNRGLLNAEVQLNGEELLPDAGENECRGSSHRCFLAGDLRVNEQPLLATMHTIFLREHNRLARELVRINPHWLKDDEKIYQEARRILIAQWQHIIYNEWLPLVLGEEFMEKFGLYPLSSGFSDDYSGDFDPRITNPFAAAGFRFGHSLIPENISKVKKDSDGNLQVEEVPLRDAFSDMDHLREPGGIDSLLRGSVVERSERVDNHFVQSIVNFLFTDGNLGIDLIALNTQRGRDHGLPGYTQYRKACNVGDAKTFDDLASNVSPKNIERLKSVYQSVDDIDLFIGMAAEEPENALVGNTYRCLIADQFARLKKGDRYFYDLEGQAGSFSPEQLYEIRKTSMSRLICDNAHDIDEIQPLAFVLANEKNPLLSCADEVGIPSLYLDYAWREGEPKYKP